MEASQVAWVLSFFQEPRDIFLYIYTYIYIYECVWGNNLTCRNIYLNDVAITYQADVVLMGTDSLDPRSFPVHMFWHRKSYVIRVWIPSSFYFGRMFSWVCLCEGSVVLVCVVAVLWPCPSWCPFLHWCPLAPSYWLRGVCGDLYAIKSSGAMFVWTQVLSHQALSMKSGSSERQSLMISCKPETNCMHKFCPSWDFVFEV